MSGDAPSTTPALDDLQAQVERLRQERDDWRKQARFLRNAFDAVPHPLYIVDAETYRIRLANTATGRTRDPIGRRCHVFTHHSEVPCEQIGHACPLEVVKNTRAPTRVEHIHFDDQGQPIHVEVNAYPIFDDEGRVVEMLEFTLDVTRRKEAEKAREAVINELNTALAEVKTLGGLIPICASCKKIRDDQGYWSQLEEYIRAHSDADFSHSICPDCRDVYLSNLPSRRGK